MTRLEWAALPTIIFGAGWSTFKVVIITVACLLSILPEMLLPILAYASYTSARHAGPQILDFFGSPSIVVVSRQ